MWRPLDPESLRYVLGAPGDPGSPESASYVGPTYREVVAHAGHEPKPKGYMDEIPVSAFFDGTIKMLELPAHAMEPSEDPVLVVVNPDGSLSLVRGTDTVWAARQRGDTHVQAEIEAASPLAVAASAHSDLWMVALSIPVPMAQAFLDEAAEANPGLDLEPLEDIHVTLCVGEVGILGSQEDLSHIVSQWVATQGSALSGSFSGYGLFSANPKPALVALPDIPALPAFRQGLLQHVFNSGYDVLEDHGFTPHMTLAYCEDDEEASSVVLPALPDELTFDVPSLIVSYGHGSDTIPLVSLAVAAALEVTHESPGTYGNPTHTTLEQEGTVPISVVADMPGRMGEVPGEHRNKQGARWDAFLADIKANGIQNPIFITVDVGERPVISEGNHRRDAAVELGMTEVPVDIRYFGHAERDTDLSKAASTHEAAEAGAVWRGMDVKMYTAQATAFYKAVQANDLAGAARVIEANLHPGGLGLGAHWSFRRDVAERFAHLGSGGPTLNLHKESTKVSVMFKADYRDGDIEYDPYSLNWSGVSGYGWDSNREEAEVTLRKGAPLSLLSMEAFIPVGRAAEDWIPAALQGEAISFDSNDCDWVSLPVNGMTVTAAGVTAGNQWDYAQDRYGPKLMTVDEAKAAGYTDGPYYHATSHAAEILNQGFFTAGAEPWEIRDPGTMEEIQKFKALNPVFVGASLADVSGYGDDVVEVYAKSGSVRDADGATLGGGMYVSRPEDVVPVRVSKAATAHEAAEAGAVWRGIYVDLDGDEAEHFYEAVLKHDLSGAARAIHASLLDSTLGSHWSFRRDVAERFSGDGSGGPTLRLYANGNYVSVLIKADYRDGDIEHDPWELDTSGVAGYGWDGDKEEAEVTLRKGAPLTVLSMEVFVPVGAAADNLLPTALAYEDISFETHQCDWVSLPVNGMTVTAGIKQKLGGFGDSPDEAKLLDEFGDLVQGPSPSSKPFSFDTDQYGGYIQETRNQGLYLDGKPLKKLYRVVDPAEWSEAQQNGYLSSDAASGSGYTRASAKPDMTWANAKGNGTVVLEIDYDQADQWHASAEGYAATFAHIPLSRVQVHGSRKQAMPWTSGPDEDWRCTQATLAAFGVFDKAPKTGAGVIGALRRAGYTYRPVETAGGEPFRGTVEEFYDTHKQGKFYIVTQDHAMALVDGLLTDTEGAGPDGRHVQGVLEVYRPDERVFTSILEDHPAPALPYTLGEDQEDEQQDDERAWLNDRPQEVIHA